MFVNEGINSDSDLKTLTPEFEWLAGMEVDHTSLHDIFAESRVIKNDEEIEILKWANLIAGLAHVDVMRKIKCGIRESALAAKFKSYCMENYNCKFQPYQCICASGHNPATLHYEVNNDMIPEKSMCLLDMGIAVQGYASDITCSYPSDGRFTEMQKQIYRIVLKANYTV